MLCWSWSCSLRQRRCCLLGGLWCPGSPVGQRTPGSGGGTPHCVHLHPVPCPCRGAEAAGGEGHSDELGFPGRLEGFPQTQCWECLKAAGETRGMQSSVGGEVGWLEGQQGWDGTSSLALQWGGVKGGGVVVGLPPAQVSLGVRALGHPRHSVLETLTLVLVSLGASGKGLSQPELQPWLLCQRLQRHWSNQQGGDGRGGDGKGGEGNRGKRRAGRAPSLAPHAIISWAGRQSCCQAADTQPGCGRAGPRVKSTLQDRV